MIGDCGPSTFEVGQAIRGAKTQQLRAYFLILLCNRKYFSRTYVTSKACLVLIGVGLNEDHLDAGSWRGMVEVPETGWDDANPRNRTVVVTTADVEAWFVREVLPLEAMLMRFLRHNWRDKSDIEDLRQEVYARVFGAARTEIPQSAKSFVFKTARNLLINMAHRANVIPIEAVSDLESLGIELDAPPPDRSLMARQELRRLQDAFDQLPPRQREAVMLGRVEGLTGRQIAARMGIAESTASDHLKLGMHALTDLYLRDVAVSWRRP